MLPCCLQAVDSFVTTAALACIYSEVMGAAIGACSARNLITMQLEAPSERHWRQVVARLQLTDLQLLQLAAGYQTFVQARKVHQRAQLAIAHLVSCEHTCSLQVLAAAVGAAVRGSSRSASSTRDGASRAAQQAPPLSSAADGHQAGGPASPAAAAPAPGNAADAAGAAAAAAAAMEDLHLDPLKVISQLLGTLNTATIAIHMLLFNTLTRRQLALVSGAAVGAVGVVGLMSALL